MMQPLLRTGSVRRGPRFPRLALLGATALVFTALALLSGGGGSLAGLSGGGSERGVVGNGRAGRALSEVQATDFSMTRAEQVVQLERLVDSKADLGLCVNGTALLEGVEAHVCEELRCLWSPALGANVDMLLNPLAVLPPSAEGAHAARCPEPRGGQRPAVPDLVPRISFVITMHNSVALTARCLLELFRTAHEVESAEFIIVDDATTDDTAEVLQLQAVLERYFGAAVLYLRNDAPVGYGEANTQGVNAASGEYIALINNDMLVVKGWLTALTQTFEQRPDAGIVGPLFLGQGDMVTEAGGIVWRDGRGANMGRGTPAVSHWFNHLRPVDYISAACVIFKRANFFKVGGFDFRFEKGYYEDTDLAMAMQSQGLEVVYQPLAVVYHQEGTTFGTDATSALKRDLMLANRAQFVDKWQQQLQADHCEHTRLHLRASRSQNSPAVLWVDDIVPEPDRDSGSIRNINIMKMLLSEGYSISFQPTAKRPPKYAAAVRGMGVHVMPVAPLDKWELSEAGSCLYDVIFVARRGVFDRAQETLKRHCPDAPIIFDTVDLHFLREARDVLTNAPGANATWNFDSVTIPKIIQWLDSSDPEAARVAENRDLELSLIDAAQLTVVVSPDEIDIITHYSPDTQIAVVSNIHEVPQLPDSKACPERSGLLFVGNMNHLPNRQAVEHLITEILPLLLSSLSRAQREDFRLHIVGANLAPEDLQQLMDQTQEVSFHGYLSDEELFALYSSVRVVVAPLLSGAGVKGKVNQAMKVGTPVVTTPLAVEGMFATDGVDCMVGSSPQEFADKVMQVYNDCRKLWPRLVAGGIRNIREHFSYEHAKPVVLEAFARVGFAPRPRSERSRCRGAQVDPPQQGAGGALRVGPSDGSGALAAGMAAEA